MADPSDPAVAAFLALQDENGKTLILIAAAVACGLVILVFARFRWQMYARGIERIPRNFMPIRAGDIPLDDHVAVMKGIAESCKIKSEVQPDPSESSLHGWGVTESGSSIHFKTNIAWSWKCILEEAAKTHTPFEESGCRTAAEYLKFLQNHRPALKAHVCETYIDAYEAARFGMKEFSEAEFEAFMKLFMLLAPELQTAVMTSDVHRGHF